MYIGVLSRKPADRLGWSWDGRTKAGIVGVWGELVAQNAISEGEPRDWCRKAKITAGRMGLNMYGFWVVMQVM